MSKVHDELKRAEYPLQAGTVVSAGLHIQGEISGNEDMLVEGIVEGPIQLGDGMLTVGAAGKITADVLAREVIVYGKLEGNLTARDRIQIKNVGSVVGDLATARIIIEDGANLFRLVSRIEGYRDAARPEDAEVGGDPIRAVVGQDGRAVSGRKAAGA